MPRVQHAAKQQVQKPAKPTRKNAHDRQAPPRRSVAPASIRKELEAAPHAEAAGMAEIVDRKGEPMIQVSEPQLVEPVKKVSKSKLEMLEFMREKVTVQIHETSEPQADPRFFIGVNGRQEVFIRGKEYTVPRYVVEGLARAKPVGFQNEEYFKPDGERAVRNPTKRGLRYPFGVISDPSGAKGADWLRHVLREP